MPDFVIFKQTKVADIADLHADRVVTLEYKHWRINKYDDLFLKYSLERSPLDGSRVC